MPARFFAALRMTGLRQNGAAALRMTGVAKVSPAAGVLEAGTGDGYYRCQNAPVWSHEQLALPLSFAWNRAGCPAGRATALRADQADARFAAAAAAYDGRRWQPAAEEFETFLKQFPADRRRGDAILFLGEARLRLGQFDEARRQYQRYLTLEPKGKHARAAAFRAAEAAYFTGNYDAAKPELERFRATRPDDSLNAYVLTYLGDIGAAKGDAAAAATLYREAIKQFPNGPLADDCRRGLRKAERKLAEIAEAKHPKTEQGVNGPRAPLQGDTAESIYDRAWILWTKEGRRRFPPVRAVARALSAIGLLGRRHAAIGPASRPTQRVGKGRGAGRGGSGGKSRPAGARSGDLPAGPTGGVRRRLAGRPRGFHDAAARVSPDKMGNGGPLRSPRRTIERAISFRRPNGSRSLLRKPAASTNRGWE